jgi:DNA polymerase
LGVFLSALSSDFICISSAENISNSALDKARKKLFAMAEAHPLFEGVKKNSGKIVFGRGSPSPKIVFIGEAPGFTENELGKPFVGRSGKLLDKWVSALNISENEYAVINAVPCLPVDEKNSIRKPTDEEVAYFKPIVLEILGLMKPKIIVLLGKTAASIFGVTARGQIQYINGLKMTFVYHPAYYLRNGVDGVNDILFLKEEINKI